jgi:hypothetical protein
MGTAEDASEGNCHEPHNGIIATVKGVANFWRLNQLGHSANARFLQALASVQPTHQTVAELDRLGRGRVVGHRRVARFHPVSPDDARLFAAALHGRHLLEESGRGEETLP